MRFVRFLSYTPFANRDLTVPLIVNFAPCWQSLVDPTTHTPKLATLRVGISEAITLGYLGS